ncbi:MAG: 30S ribosomal protein S6 [Thermodesulfobacteriota bacterium]
MERCYETIFIMHPELIEEKRTGITQKVENIIKKFGGRMLSIKEWGNKRLAYPIKRSSEGYYVQVNFNGSSQTVNEIERIFRLDEKVLRYQTMRINEEDVKVKDLKDDSCNSEDVNV